MPPVGNRVFRLSRPVNVAKGSWYFTVRCRGCGISIYVLTDPNNGQVPHPFQGGGKFSIGCYSCFHEDLYDPDTLTSVRAPKSIEFRRPQPKASGSSRQPLNKKYRKVWPTFSAEWLEDRPEAASAIARCMALWAEVEINLARLLGHMLGDQDKAAVAIFLALKSSRTQNDVMNAAAKVALTFDDQLLFEAVMAAAAGLEKQRNDLAHGQFGGAYAVKRGILWITPSDLIQHSARTSLNGVTPEGTAWVRERTFVYEPEDIQTTVEAMAALKDLIGGLSGLLSPDWKGREERRAQRYKELCGYPIIAEQMAKLLARRAADG